MRSTLEKIANFMENREDYYGGVSINYREMVEDIIKIAQDALTEKPRTRCEVFHGCAQCGSETAYQVKASAFDLSTNIHDDSLLFRIYDTQQKKLMLPEFSEIGCTFGDSPDGVHYPKDASDFLFDICAWEGHRYLADKSTGLRDAAGHIIYENDEYEKDGQRHRIIWVDKNASFFDLNLFNGDVCALNDSSINITKQTIIGNIHDY